jgi:hypothetical protein
MRPVTRVSVVARLALGAAVPALLSAQPVPDVQLKEWEVPWGAAGRPRDPSC